MRSKKKKFVKLLVGLFLLLILHLTITIYELISYLNSNELKSSDSSIKMRFFAFPEKFSDYKNNLIIYVKSPLKNFKGRKAIRKTWGLTANLFKIPVIFAVGTSGSGSGTFGSGSGTSGSGGPGGPGGPGSPRVEKKIKEEILTFGDILWGNFSDEKNLNENFVLKTISIILYHQNFNLKFPYVFFTDDEVFVLVKNLKKFICEIEAKKISNVIVGNCSTDEKKFLTIRNPKDKRYEI